MERSLNLDIPERVTELEVLIKKVLPRNIFYRLLLSKGVEFDGYRDYTFMEDASLIDWKASVRGRQILVKKYIEEKNLKFLFFIDVGDNMIFGSREKLKCEYTAELSAALIHLIIITGEKAGYVLFNNHIVHYKKPTSGGRNFDMFTHEISNPYNYGGISDLNRVLEDFVPTMDKSTSMVFLISDFIRANESYKRNLETLSSLFETVAIIVRDPLDKTLPDINKEVIIEDPVSGEKILINPKVAKGAYEAYSALQLNTVKKIFKDLNIDFLELYTPDSSSEGIAMFLRERLRLGRTKKKDVY